MNDLNRVSNDFYKIVIIGRPNVGKSALFNRLVGKRRSLVHNEPGVTRDRIKKMTEWWLHGQSYPILLVDTGGMGGDHFQKEIDFQVQIAIQEADLVFFTLDAQTGVIPQDQELLKNLASAGVLAKIPVFAVVNKIDDYVHEPQIADFFSLGLDVVLPASAEHGRGIDDLKECALQTLIEIKGKSETKSEGSLEKESPPKIAVVGRPNVGKSTFVNAILGENRMITSPIPGTTSDSVDSLIYLNEIPFQFIDTAGIRRKGKTEQGIEVLSVVQTRKTLQMANVAILMLDGEVGVSDQDEKISGLIEDVGCGVILVVNKWDTQKKNNKFTPQMAAEQVRKKMAYLKYAPLLFVSSLKKEGFDGLGPLIEEVLHQRQLKISTKEFTDWVRHESTVHNPRDAKFFLCHQSGRNPPTFVCHVNDPEKIDFSLKRHLINALRERWGYMGNPVRLLFVKANRRSLPRKQKAPRKSNELASKVT